MTSKFKVIGDNLRQARVRQFPQDTIPAFATRCEIGLSTYKKMESGDLSVGMQQYYKAAEVLNLQSTFKNLFQMEEDWFNE